MIGLLASLSGCSDPRQGGLHEGLLETQRFLTTDCPKHAQLKSAKDHVCVLTLQELAKSSDPALSPNQQLCQVLFSETGRKLYPKRSAQEFTFDQKSATGWPSRIALTMQSEVPWSVVLTASQDSIQLNTYGSDVNVPLERAEIKQVPQLKP